MLQVLIIMFQGIVESVHLAKSDDDLRSLWMDIVSDSTRQICDETEVTIEEGFKQGRFVNHKTEYIIMPVEE